MIPRIQKTLGRRAIAILCIAVVANFAAAQQTPREKLMAKRGAQADAYRRLAEQIMGLKVSSSTTVRDFVTESDRIATELDTCIKGARFSEPRYFEDGACEIDATVTIEQVVTTLQRTSHQLSMQGKWTDDGFRQISQRVERSDIAVTGSGTAKVDAPDPLSQPIVMVREPPMPAVFKNDPAARLRAYRIAEVDAYRLLMERVYGLHITSTTLVKDFVLRNDTIQTRFANFLRGARTAQVTYKPDGIVEIRMEVTIAQVIDALKRAAAERGADAVDFDNMPKVTGRRIVSVVGSGALTHAADE